MTKQLLILTLGLAVSASALAYKDGTYTCKNAVGLPDNTYKITTQSIGDTGVPFVEIHRYYKNGEGKTNQVQIRGYAVVSKGDEVTELLALGNMRLEFNGDELYNCAK